MHLVFECNYILWLLISQNAAFNLYTKWFMQNYLSLTFKHRIPKKKCYSMVFVQFLISTNDRFHLKINFFIQN